jgi:hypothetical protein
MIYGFHILCYVPSTLSYFMDFIMKEYQTLSKTFSVPIEMVRWFFCPCFCIYNELHLLTYIYWLNHSCVSGMKPTWSWYVIFKMSNCWIWFASIFLRISVTISIKEFLSLFSFFYVLIWFWYHNNMRFIEWVW